MGKMIVPQPELSIIVLLAWFAIQSQWDGMMHVPRKLAVNILLIHQLCRVAVLLNRANFIYAEVYM